MERDLLVEMFHRGGTEEDEEANPERGSLEGDRFVRFFFAFFCVIGLEEHRVEEEREQALARQVRPATAPDCSELTVAVTLQSSRRPRHLCGDDRFQSTADVAGEPAYGGHPNVRRECPLELPSHQRLSRARVRGHEAGVGDCACTPVPDRQRKHWLGGAGADRIVFAARAAPAP